ncbi:HAD hydrolase-like protein [Streptomyces sp. DSM 44917]|uniref:HAD hydrolase-like protein n=1 Tax=Streptomyces boetiae TaxID=3075541 RepID=A0ABU2L631_9ACTN|nr:HAD hydrolase-like protein [Streptomyces sp. DSM 44917]MDT0307014.1 HAD hydrolase-like protein [Streptomyces sp. DSM 44917]
MMQPKGALADSLSGVRLVLVDFDGPFCSVFAGIPADEVSARLRQQLSGAGHPLSPAWEAEPDPLALLSRIAGDAPALVPEADKLLTELETEAAGLARPNEDVERVLEACAHTGRSVAVVSNNSGASIRAYLAQHALTSRVAQVYGRVPGDPASMKPSPRLLLDAMGDVPPAACVFLGDAVRDVEAGHAAGVATIGYANKERKKRSLADAGAVAVVTSLLPVADALYGKDVG